MHQAKALPWTSVAEVSSGAAMNYTSARRPGAGRAVFARDAHRPMAPMNQSRREFFPYIDGLRAVSILAVVLFHLDPRLLPGGFAGVDVFFTVSGFVVSSSLHDMRAESFRALAAFFYARRFRRIAPALLAMLAVTSLFAGLFTPYAYLSSFTFNVGVAAFLGYSNIVLARGVDYFSPLGEFTPFTHTWSLAVEEQFYLVFPFIFFFLLKKRRMSAAAVGALALLCAASFAYGLVENRLPIDLGFYSSLARFWEIGAGVLLYTILFRTGLFETAGRAELAWATWSGCGLLALAFVMGAKTQFPVPGALPAVAGVAMAIVGLHGRVPRSAPAFLLTRPAMLWLGALSYSLYLWHWPVFVMFRWTVGFSTPVHKVVALVIAVVLAVLSFYLVERPLRRAAFLQAPRRAIPIALAALLAGSQAVKPVLSHESPLALSIVNANRNDWYPDPRSAPRAPDGCSIARAKTPLTVGTRIDVARTGCAAPPAGGTLFVIGDSHAFVYAAMFDAFALETGVGVSRYDIPGCTFLPILPLPARCHDVVAVALADMAGRLKPGDVVFLPGLRVPRFRDQWHEAAQDVAPFFVRAEELKDHAFDEAAGFLEKIARPGVRFVLELPKPIFRTPLFRCVDWFNRANPGCRDGVEIDRAFMEAYRAPVLRFAARLAGRFDLTTWDALPFLCGPRTCSMWRDGHPLFFDGDHVSAYANAVLAGPFHAEMARHGLGAPAR